MKKEELIAEILENARKDRKRLEAVADGLLEGSKTFLSEDDEGEINTEVAAAFAEEVAKVSEVLTRINHELVELVKVDKTVDRLVPTQLKPSEVDEVYDSIQPEEQAN